MTIRVEFENIEELKKVYDPITVERAARRSVKELNRKAATLISRSVRSVYAVSAADIRAVLDPRIQESGGVPTGYLVYLSRRISLRRFATRSSRPRVKTARGVRYGARVKVRKDQRAAIVPGAFWGTPQGGGQMQIFQRVGASRLGIKKLTAPAISQMVRGEKPIDDLNAMLQAESSVVLSRNLDFFLQRQAGVL